KDNLLQVTRLLTIKKASVPVAEWETYKGFAKAITADRDSWIQFGSENGPDSKESKAANPEADRDFSEGYEALQRHDMSRARESFQRVLDNDPEYPGAHANMGIVYLDGGNIDGGIIELKKEVELHPKDPFSYEVLARVYAYNHDNASALQQLRKLL